MKRTLLFVMLLAMTISTKAQVKKTYKIGVLIDNNSSKTTPLFNLLKDQVKAVVGENAIIEFPDEYLLVNQYDKQKAQENYQKLLSNETDIILAFGVINNSVIVNQSAYSKPTILFGAINQDIQPLDLTKKTSGIDNFTYLVETESYVDDLKKFKELTDFKKLGVIVDKPLEKILPYEKTFAKATSDLEASHTMIPFEQVSDITSQLDSVDAVYLAGGFFMENTEVESLAKALIKKKIPSFTTNGIDQLNAGLMATMQARENRGRFFRRIALTIDSYINGTPLSEMPVLIDYEYRLTINYNTAELTDVPIKYSLIATTDFVGEFKNSLSEKQYTLLDVIQQVIDENLALKTVQKDVLLSEQEVKTAKSNYLPSLTAAGGLTYNDPEYAKISNGQNPEFQTSGNLTLDQTIFSEGANANISIQQSLLKAQQENLNAEQLNSILEASSSYFTSLILKANAQILFENLNLTKTNLAIAEENFDAGQSGKFDLLRFRSQMAQNTQSMVEAVNQLEQSYIDLNRVMNNPLDKEIDVKEAALGEGVFEEYNYEQLASILDNPSLRESFINFLIEEAKNNSPELKALDYNREAINRNIKYNKTGRFYPNLGLQGQYNSVLDRSGEGDVAPDPFELIDNFYTVGVNLSIPIVNRNQTNINLQTATIQKDQLELNTSNTELTIASNIRNNVFNLVNQISNIQLSNVSEQAAKEALELTQSSYSKGAVTVIQLIDAQNNLLSAQLSQNNAVYNYLLSALQLERSIGYYFLLHTDEENNEFTNRFLEFNTNTDK